MSYTVQRSCIIFTFSDLNGWPGACLSLILLRWISLPKNKVRLGTFTVSVHYKISYLIVYIIVLTMVMLLSWTAGFPGGRINTLTLQLTDTLAPEVLIVERGGDVTSNSSESGCSIRVGFWQDRQTRRINASQGVVMWLYICILVLLTSIMIVPK